MSSSKHIIIIGGGAAGFFTAIRAAEVAQEELRAGRGQKTKITILESSDALLKKVRISGGGRCNVTHNLFEVRPFTQNYPRGEKELLSPMQRFQARDTVAWFRERGVILKAEEDGRMFPVTDSSQTIIDCFMKEIERLGITILTRHSVQSIEKVSYDSGTKDAGQFKLHLKDETLTADRVMIATGSGQIGYKLAEQLGHKITELAPSLFSFKIEHPLLKDLPGLSFENAHLKLVLPASTSTAKAGDSIKVKNAEKTFTQRGPILITHWGISGPALLKLSAWVAREMMHSQYKGTLIVNWLGHKNVETAQDFLKSLKNQNVKMQLANVTPAGLTKRFWLKLLEVHTIDAEKRWADLSGKEITKLAEALYSSYFEVLGKNRYKDEFVECGGVDLREINFKKMESKITPGLFFAGEVLDVDGITGGFNFQNAWTGGYIAGEAMSLWVP